MKILITGSNGFIGKNLKYFLIENKYKILEQNRNDNIKKLIKNLYECDLIIHLAGENRPKDKNLFKINNENFTKSICKTLIDNNLSIPIIYSSTVHFNENNAYGSSKKICENFLYSYQKKLKAPLSILRLPNIYGKWAKNNYNSAVATFCHNISRNKKIYISDNKKIINLLYIDDLLQQINEIIVDGKFRLYPKIKKIYSIKLIDIVTKIKNFKEKDKIKELNNFKNSFDKNLFSTYISHLPQNKFASKAKMKSDTRGNFIEFVKFNKYGQVSLFTTLPNQERGGHYHNSKVEEFLVIEGRAKLKYKNLYNNKQYIKIVDSKKLNFFKSIPGWVHSIKNIGKNSLICAVWANEIFNKDKPDTYSYKTK
jgi:UDP-2-acetamido-2,6-beta-L-arabino-hexul-4-ose reductase